MRIYYKKITKLELVLIACFIELSLFLNPAFCSNMLSSGEEIFLNDLEERTFRFFLDNTDSNGLTIESTAWPVGSSASSGFYLTSIPIGIERGWISRDEGYRRALATINAYYDDPIDTDDFFVESNHGFFPHWFNRTTGKWNEVDCFSSIDTAILMAGALTVGQYFEATEVQALADRLYRDVNWSWMMDGNETLYLGWKPGDGFLPDRWVGYNEGMLLVLLALGSPTHPVPQSSWEAWTQTYTTVNITHGNESYHFVQSNSPALFTYQYPHVWFDLKEKIDRQGIDYFNNSLNATLENRAYCIENPMGHRDYGPNLWGLTACECPCHENFYGVHEPFPFQDFDDGTISPSGVGGSIYFAPVESLSALQYIMSKYGARVYGEYGFRDAFNTEKNEKCQKVPDSGKIWVSPNYVGINQGVILAMTENFRSDLIHEIFMTSEYAERALDMAGFGSELSILK